MGALVTSWLVATIARRQLGPTQGRREGELHPRGRTRTSRVLAVTRSPTLSISLQAEDHRHETQRFLDRVIQATRDLPKRGS